MFQDHKVVIDLLGQLYPRCFFTNPKQRKPLKKNIANDIDKLSNPALAEYDIYAAVDWYTGHIGYDYGLTPGAERIDLNGQFVGKVTETEGREARERIAIKHREMAKRRGDPQRTIQALYGTGGMTDDQLRKIPAPPVRIHDGAVEDAKAVVAKFDLSKSKVLMVALDFLRTEVSLKTRARPTDQMAADEAVCRINEIIDDLKKLRQRLAV
jgi:sRNA-binding protein